MLDRDRSFGQEDVAVSTAATPPGPRTGPLVYFFTAVAAGVTVFFITRWLGKR